jgi:hypothetical protein
LVIKKGRDCIESRERGKERKEEKESKEKKALFYGNALSGKIEKEKERFMVRITSFSLAVKKCDVLQARKKLVRGKKKIPYRKVQNLILGKVPHRVAQAVKSLYL